MAEKVKEIFLAGCHGEILGRPAVAAVNQTATYEQMEMLGSKWPEANFDAELLVKLAMGARSILGWDAIRVPCCQTIEEEALGCKVKPGDDKNLPSIAERAFNPKEDPSPTYPEDFLNLGRVPMLIKAVKLAKEAVGDDAAIIAGVIGPFTIVSELIGIKDTLRFVLRDKDGLTPYLEMTTRAVTELAQELVKAGADAICIEDMMASVDMISPKSYKEVALPAQQELISKISVPSILHVCGKVDLIAADMVASGATALSFEPKADLNIVNEAIKASGRKVGLIGGIDTITDFFQGDVKTVQDATVKAVQDGYHVIAPGCAVPPATSLDKLKIVIDTVRAGV